MSNNEEQRMVTGIFILAAAIALSIGLGFAIGAGTGWIFFGLFLVLVVLGNVKKAGKGSE